jgi:non-heme chloroperoxidase
VLVSPIPPTFMNPDKNPDGVPKEVVDQIRNGILQRMLFYKKTRDYPH